MGEETEAIAMLCYVSWPLYKVVVTAAYILMERCGV